MPILPLLGKAVSMIFGMGTTGSVANNVGGLAVHAALIPVLYYLWDNYNQILDLKLPLWVLAVAVAIGYGLIERWRRGLPGAV